MDFGRKGSAQSERTGKLHIVTTGLAMENVEMEIDSGLKAFPRRARSLTTFMSCRLDQHRRRGLTEKLLFA